jgi:hypothetical protein
LEGWSADEDGRRLLGVNTWDGVEWFRKEGFDLAAAGAALAVIFSPTETVPYDARLSAAERCYAALEEAREPSEFRIDGMTKELIR